MSGARYKIQGLPVPVEFLQLLDRWVFSFFCLLLTFGAALGRASGIELKKPKKILLVKLAEQGSSVLAISAMQSAVRMVGRENVFAIVFEENRFILDVIGIIPPENIYPVKQNSIISMAASTLAHLAAIRRQKIDAAVDLEFFARFSAAITFLSGARIRSGLHAYFGEGPYRGDLMTHRVLYNPHLHTSQMFDVLVNALREDPRMLPTYTVPSLPSPLPMKFQAPSPEKQKLRRKLFSHVPLKRKQKIILINPNASDLLPLRKWESAKYIELIRKLLRKYPDAVVGLTGSERERDGVEEIHIAARSPRCINLAGQTSLDELMVLFCISDVLITNDSGPAHFASLTSISTVVLFGPETPALFAAQNPRSQAVYLGLPCSPCINALNNRQTACRDNQCMKGITVDMVLDHVTTALGQ